MRKNGKGTYRDDGDRTCSVYKRAKQGNQQFPGKPRKLHYKRRGWVVKKAAKKRKKHKKEEILQEKLSKNLCRKENTKGKKKVLLPGILQKPLLHILGFNENQTLQVLKAEIAIQDCNF